MTTETEVAKPEEKLKKEAEVVLSTSKAVAVIGNDRDYTAAGERLKLVKAGIKNVEEFFTPLKRAQDAAKKVLLDKEKETLAPYLEAERVLKGGMIAYQTEQERKAEEERKRLQAEAADAERKRQAEEAKEREADAEALEAFGDTEGAVAALEDAEAIKNAVPAPVYVPPVMVERPKVAGQSVKTVYKAKCTDLRKLVAFVAANPMLIHLLLPNETAIRKMAQEQRDLFQVPGCECWTEKELSSRSA